MNKTAKTTTKQTYRYKEHTSSYQWERGGAIKGYRRKKDFMGIYEIMFLKLLETVKHYRIKRIFHSIKKKKKNLKQSGSTMLTLSLKVFHRRKFGSFNKQILPVKIKWHIYKAQ